MQSELCKPLYYSLKFVKTDIRAEMFFKVI